MQVSTLKLYLQWNRQNVEDLKKIEKTLADNTIAYIQIGGVIAALNTEAQFLEFDIKAAEQENIHATDLICW